jgi:hypothetical protein
MDYRGQVHHEHANVGSVQGVEVLVGHRPAPPVAVLDVGLAGVEVERLALGFLVLVLALVLVLLLLLVQELLRIAQSQERVNDVLGPVGFLVPLLLWVVGYNLWRGLRRFDRFYHLWFDLVKDGID